MHLRFGLGAWSNSHFEHTLYPLRTLHEEYLPRYATAFDCVEANVLHHRMPAAPFALDIGAWVKQTPEKFLFLPKMHKSVTHGDADESTRIATAKAWLAGVQPLRDAKRLGPILLQFPAQLERERGAAFLQSLLRLANPGAFAVEVRHKSWFTGPLETLLTDHEAPLVWSTFPKAFAPPWATAERGYVRFTGKHAQTRGRHVTVADRLNDILEIRKRLSGAKWGECFVIVTNPFEGNAVDSMPRIAAALGDAKLAKRLTRMPGEALFPDAKTLAKNVHIL